MAVERALNAQNDIFASNGRIAIVEEGEQVVQSVRCRLQFLQGEWFLDIKAGIPYWTEIFTKPVDLGVVSNIFKSEINNTDGVKEITNFDMVYDENTRKLEITFSAETVYGTIDSSKLYINNINI